MATIRIQRVAGDDLVAHEAAVEVIRRGFLPHEAVCAALEVTRFPHAERELLNLVRATLKDGVSVAAYDGDVMVGVATNKIQTSLPAGEMSFFERFAKEEATHPVARYTVDIMHQVDSMADLFAEAGGEPLVELMFLGVLPEAGRRGVGLSMAKKSVAVAKSIGAKGVCAMWSSDHSRSIGRKLGFREIIIAEHTEFEYDNKTLSEVLPDSQQRTVLALLPLE